MRLSKKHAVGVHCYTVDRHISCIIKEHGTRINIPSYKLRKNHRRFRISVIVAWLEGNFIPNVFAKRGRVIIVGLGHV